MTTGASITFSAFVDDTVMFSSKDEVNTFFSNIRVPAATQIDYGVVKKAQTVVYNYIAMSNSDSALINVDGVNAFEVPSKASLDEMKTAFAVVQQALSTLITKLQQAGIMT